MHQSKIKGLAAQLGIAVLLALAGLPGAAAQGALDCLPEATPKWAQPQPRARASAVVFLHGLHGHGLATWTAAGTAAWPCLVLADRPIFRDSGVYLTSYHTEPGAGNPSTTDAARRVARDLVADGVFDHQHVSVVAHSMGGIVLARMLATPGILTDEQRRRVRLVLFVGTPAEPTEAASLCSKFGINEQCTEMGNADAMRELWSAWDRLPQRPSAWCTAEGANMWFPSWTLTRRIVPVDSAFRPCRHPEHRSVAHGLDHSDVAKPLSTMVEPHRTLRHAFATCVRPTLRAAAAHEAAVPLSAAVSRWFYELKDSLERERQDWSLPLVQVLSTEVNRYWYPDGLVPSFEVERHERLGPSAFVQALRQTLPELLPSAEFDWVEPADRVHERVSDGAMEALVQRMRERGGLDARDLFAAVRFRQREVDGQWLLVLRPAGGRPGGFAVLGVLAVPRPAAACRS